MAGILYGVGVGPGDSELLTLKAVRTIEQCDVIGIPVSSPDKCTAYQIALKEIPSLSEKEIISVMIPMTSDADILDDAYNNGSRRLMERLDEGKNIAFLNLGDPTVYGTYMQLHSRMVDGGYEAYLISGVNSFCTVAARLGIPIGSRASAIHVLPGYYSVDKEGQESDIGKVIKNYLISGDTVILMKSAGRLSKIKKQLIALEKEGFGKAYAVTNCGMENEMIFRNISELPEDAGYFTTIIIT